MQRQFLALSLTSLFAFGLATAEPFSGQAGQATFASPVSETLATYKPRVLDPDDMAHASTRAAAANLFLGSLDEAQRTRAAQPIDSGERSQWSNLPAGQGDDSLRLGDLNGEQRERACDLLATVLSTAGYERVRNILLADDRLLQDNQPRPGFGAENFWVAIFGDPSEEQTWALQLDGHHLALNMTFSGEDVSMSPSFLGAQPAAFDYEEQRFEPLAGAVDDAFDFVAGLTEEQRARAIVQAKRGQLQAGAGRDGFVPEAVGLLCDSLNQEQRKQLEQLLTHYVGNLPALQAKRRMAELLAEIDHMHFAWSGPVPAGSDISYRIQGPTLLIEFACQDLGGIPLNHLHSIYRNPTNEYGQASR